jgi:hypothetical protein
MHNPVEKCIYADSDVSWRLVKGFVRAGQLVTLGKVGDARAFETRDVCAPREICHKGLGAIVAHFCFLLYS